MLCLNLRIFAELNECVVLFFLVAISLISKNCLDKKRQKRENGVLGVGLGCSE